MLTIKAHLELTNDSSSSTYTACSQAVDIPTLSTKTVVCDSPVIARYVRLRHDDYRLAVCEVIVTGHLYIGK